MKKLRILTDMLRQVLDITPNAYRKKIPKLIFFMIISSLLELLSVALIVPFISVILDPDALMENNYVIVICNAFDVSDKYALVLFLSIVLIVAFIVKNIVLLSVRQYQIAYGISLQEELSTKLLRSYLMRPYSFFLDSNTGQLSTRITTDTAAIYTILCSFMTIFAESLTVFTIGCYILYTDIILAIGVLSAAAVCVVVVILGLKNRISSVGMRRMKATYENGKQLLQALNGIKDISVTRRRQHFVDSYTRTYDEKAAQEKAFNFYNMLPERIIEVFFVGSIILIVTFRMRWGTNMTEYVSKLAAFAMAAYRLLPSIGKYTSEFNQLIYYQPVLVSGYNAVKEAENYQNSIQASIVESVQTEQRSFDKELCVNNLTFRYKAELPAVLEELSLCIKKGDAIGLVGESGSGKSTLADVILGLLVAEAGGVYVDGVDVRTIPDTWAHLIGYVPQSVFLVDGSIRENIGFGLDQEDINDDMVWKALEKASLRKFVEGLEEQLDSQVGERGVKLSGGQCQRIAIARALYSQPSILVLDEATSALDNDTETAIMESIENLIGSVTLIIVAHRLTTIRNCNKIYEIKDGKAIERTKEELGIG